MNLKNNNKKLSIKSVSIILIITLVLATFLPGCSVKDTKVNIAGGTTASTTAGTVRYDNTTVLSCPECGLNGNIKTVASDDGYTHYKCGDCGCEWYYLTDGSVEKVLADGTTQLLSTTKAAVSSSKSTTKKSSSSSKKTTKSSSNKATTVKYKEPSGDVVDIVVDKDGNITTVGNKGVFGFAYSQNDKCFYATNEAWQRNFGYSQLYDKTSSVILISYDTARVYFTYDGLEWMVQLWKGQYGLVLVGAEIGVYNRAAGSSASSYYDCADDDHRLYISMDVYRDGSKIFGRSYSQSWWLTGFVPGTLNSTGAYVTSTYTKKLRVDGTITLNNEEMADAFVEGLNNVTYIYNNVDKSKRSFSFTQGVNYSRSGKTVSLSWQ